jgi:hypothetical protein
MFEFTKTALPFIPDQRSGLHFPSKKRGVGVCTVDFLCNKLKVAIELFDNKHTPLSPLDRGDILDFICRPTLTVCYLTERRGVGVCLWL